MQNTYFNQALSAPLRKAFTKNVQQDRYRPVNLTTTDLETSPIDGMFGAGGAECLLAMPYCEGAVYQSFAMRIYGWRSIGPEPTGKPKVWVWNVLGEFLCVAGMIPGPVLKDAPGLQGYNLPIGPGENMAESIALTRGVLGLKGWINSMPPGSGCPATAVVELYGCQLISFDFVTQFPGNSVAANCLWSKSGG